MRTQHKAAATLVGQVISPNSRSIVAQLAELFTGAQGTDFRVTFDDSLLAARRNVYPALAANGMGVSSLASDAAVPPSRLPELLNQIAALEKEHSRPIAVVAHAGDGNIHASVWGDVDDPADVKRASKVIDLISQIAVRLNGTVTGEHGIGSLKRHLLSYALDDTSRDIHQRIKTALDPQGTLNPGRGI